jgi:hypothetical protein
MISAQVRFSLSFMTRCDARRRAASLMGFRGRPEGLPDCPGLKGFRFSTLPGLFFPLFFPLLAMGGFFGSFAFAGAVVGTFVRMKISFFPPLQ